MMCVFTLVLLALIALWSSSFACQEPSISVSGDRVWNSGLESGVQTIIARYGGEIDIYCSGTDSSKLKIQLRTGFWGGELQHMEIVNKTTVKLNVDTKNYREDKYHNYDFVYLCTDVEAVCDTKVQMIILPLLTIESPNLIHNSRGYFIPVGDHYEVICLGHPKFDIVNDDGQEIETVRINQTCIKLRVHATEINSFTHNCRHVKTLIFHGNREFKASIHVHVDYPPAPKNLLCMEFISEISCSWTTLSSNINFTLFYMGKNGKYLRLYEDKSGKETHCKFSLKYIRKQGFDYNENLSLVMEACNTIYCVNHTHQFNRFTITKIEPPKRIKLLKVNLDGAILTWKKLKYDASVEYRVMYRLTGTKLRQLDAIPHCNKGKCEMELKLPCPGALYEVQLCAKLTSTPRTNEYWSDAASIFFRTHSAGAIDSLCYEEPELIVNKDGALYAMHMLAKEFRENGDILYDKVNSMKQKLFKTNEVCQV